MDNKNKNPNVPNLRFSTYSDNWQYISINNLLSFQNGLNADASKYGKGIPYISVGDILNNNYITFDKIKGLVDIDKKTLNNYSVTYGDIVFQRSSEVPEDIGQSNVYLDKEHIATFGGFVIRGKKIGEYNPLFFHYLLKNINSRRSIIRLGAGAQHYNIGQENLKTLFFKFPSLQEQEKISYLFYLLDQRIATQNKIIEDYKLLKNRIINDTFTKNNKEIKLKKIISEICNKNHNNNENLVLSVSNKLGFIKQSDQFEDREIASANTSNYKIVFKGQYAYNPARINVGSIARLINFESGIISPMYVCFSINHEKINSIILDMFLLSNCFKRQLNNKLEGSVRQCLTFNSLGNISIYLPTSSQQTYIAHNMDKLNQLIDNESQILEYYKKVKKYLLNNLFI